ncbi:type IV pilus modification PilV family protein [Kribbella monticola]|uniref:type IV pilus modification PilV family protein n=1 Tax=Kribbella monticola TaxID=2185285 RepID=UPI000DD4D336|nr:type II secretion system protein [Kribbella monticola]
MREHGESLLELVVAVALMGVAVVAVMSGLTTTVLMSDVQRKQATVGVVVRDYAEALQQYVASGHYVACGSTYNVPDFVAPQGFSAKVVAGSVQYWSVGLTWLPLCLLDTGLQRVRVSATSADGRATEYVYVVLRRPCGVEDPPCS